MVEYRNQNQGRLGSHLLFLRDARRHLRVRRLLGLSLHRRILIRPTTDYWITLSGGYLGIGSRHSLYSLLIPLWALTSLGVLLTVVLGWYGHARTTDAVGFPVEAYRGEDQ